MHISIFELFSVGIGPSSSHTVGPMRAAATFLKDLVQSGHMEGTVRVQAELFGSLGLTGKGHGTDVAVMLGLEGDYPESVDPSMVPERINTIRESKRLNLSGQRMIDFDAKVDLIFNRREVLKGHPNGMRFHAFGTSGELATETFYSIGGGFIVRESDLNAEQRARETAEVPFPFDNAEELIGHCKRENLSTSDIMYANECALRPTEEVDAYLDLIWKTMQECVHNGLHNTGTLPGGLKVERRAAKIYYKLKQNPEASLRDPLTVVDWVNLYALAVNEENAGGGRVVTAPTNGAAGIIPSVLHYATRFHPRKDEQKQVRNFLLTSAAIGSLYKKNASISGADVGCQGEVGVACSMAAGALAEYMGCSPEQIENAAEVGMEHNLGLTCDPIGGLVQIPCIERNAMGAVKAINAARIAWRGDGDNFVSLDKVIRTMLATGRDMKKKYKETARGGLAVNVVEC